MKLISEHLGEIIVALVGVALLIGAIIIFKPQLEDFFTNIVTKLTAVGDNVLEQFDSFTFDVATPPAG